MRNFYCANCGTRLTVTRRALPKYATIIDIVEVHKCSKEPIEFDLKPVFDTYALDKNEDKQKFVQSLNELDQPTVSTAFLRDRRFDPEPGVTKLLKAKSTAPPTIFKIIEQMEGSTPDHPLDNIESEE